MLQCVKIKTEQNLNCIQQSDLACKYLVIVARFNVQLARQNAAFTIAVSKKKTIFVSNYKRWNAELFHCNNGSDFDSL